MKHIWLSMRILSEYQLLANRAINPKQNSTGSNNRSPKIVTVHMSKPYQNMQCRKQCICLVLVFRESLGLYSIGSIQCPCKQSSTVQYSTVQYSAVQCGCNVLAHPKVAQTVWETLTTQYMQYRCNVLAHPKVAQTVWETLTPQYSTYIQYLSFSVFENQNLT